MKKIKVLLATFVLTSMTVVSCSSDDSSGSTATVEGKWNQIKTVVKFGNQSVTQDYDLNETGCDKDYIEFAAASVYNDVVYNSQGGECIANAAEPGTWIKTDDKLTIENAGLLSDTYDIKKLTSSDLQISVTDSSGGITSTTTIFLKKVK